MRFFGSVQSCLIRQTLYHVVSQISLYTLDQEYTGAIEQAYHGHGYQSIGISGPVMRDYISRWSALR